MLAVLTEEQRVFIIRRLALFDPYSDIIEAFRRRWPETRCEHDDVEAVDPRRSKLSEIHQAIFNANRNAFITDNAIAHPTSDKQVRLIELHSMYRLARDRNAIEIAAELLEQIRVEVEGPAKGGAGGPASAMNDPTAAPVASITRTVVYPAGKGPNDYPAAMPAAEPAGA